MGLLADTMRALALVAFRARQTPSPQRPAAVGATVPTWQAGMEQFPRHGYNYETFAREGYAQNEIVYACVEELATSAAEPQFRALRRVHNADGSSALEPHDDHDVLRLLERPNPFMDRFALLSTLIMHRSVAGNAYWEKVRSGAGRVVELWPLRPDRVRVIPDATTYIAGYMYEIGGVKYQLPARDVIHFRNRHPLDDYYGLPPLAVAAGRVDLDNWARAFTAAFFRNAGVPSGLLTVRQALDPEDKRLLRDRYRQELGGPAGWHSLWLLEENEATYTQLGLPMGDRGVALPSLDEMTEARIAMCFGVPLSLIGARLGMASSSYANRRADIREFWENTLRPIYVEIASRLTLDLAPEFSDVERIEFDLTTVSALAEDQDAVHARIREDVKAGLMTLEEGRVALGLTEEPDGARRTYYIPANIVPTPADQLVPDTGAAAAESSSGEDANAAALTENENKDENEGAEPALNKALRELTLSANISPRRSLNGHGHDHDHGRAREP